MIDVPSDAPQLHVHGGERISVTPADLAGGEPAGDCGDRQDQGVNAPGAAMGGAFMGRVVLVARARMDLDERAPAVGCHADFGVPPSPGDADGPGALFFGAPGPCWWTFTLVESMASTRISTPMIRSSCDAVNRRSIAPFPDQRLNRRQTVIHLP